MTEPTETSVIPVEASASSPPAKFDPSDHEAERIRLFRAAGIDIVDMVKRAALTTLRAMESEDLEHALRGADQAYRLGGAYSGKSGEAKDSKVAVQVNIAPFAQPRQ